MIVTSVLNKRVTCLVGLWISVFSEIMYILLSFISDSYYLSLVLFLWVVSVFFSRSPSTWFVFYKCVWCDIIVFVSSLKLHPPFLSAAARCVSPTPMAVSCCRILRERREGIIRGMTEGRLNNLLDVLISRRALPLEAYEVISASLTLTARTRSLLDTCTCLGEHAASLVATTLGMMSIGTNRGPSQMSHWRWMDGY